MPARKICTPPITSTYRSTQSIWANLRMKLTFLLNTTASPPHAEVFQIPHGQPNFDWIYIASLSLKSIDSSCLAAPDGL
jgi:hypothetical protein